MACYDRSQYALTRRQVLGRSLGFGLSMYAAKSMPLFRALEAAEASAAAAPDAPILVSVFLPGGCDLLSTLTPMEEHGKLKDLRKALALDDIGLLPGDRSLGLHPALSRGLNGGVKGLVEAGKIGFLPGIDYADPDLSHFHSRHFWERGHVTHADGPGWLGTWLDKHGNPDNPLQGVSVSGGLSPLLRTASVPVAAVESPNDAELTFSGTWGIGAEKARDAWSRLAAVPRSGPGPIAAARAAAMAQVVGDKLSPYKADAKKGIDPLAPSVAYPEKNELGERLRHLAGMLSLPLGIRVAAVEAEGDFDTHDDQPAELDAVLGDVSEALAAFQADLEARGLADRVLTFVWSEFGRRPQANDSDGTDHGAGGIAWVQGTRAKPGVLTEYPSLGKLDREDNLAVTVDFRKVYSSLLEGWMQTDAGAIIPDAGRFGRLDLVR